MHLFWGSKGCSLLLLRGVILQKQESLWVYFYNLLYWILLAVKSPPCLVIFDFVLDVLLKNYVWK